MKIKPILLLFSAFFIISGLQAQKLSEHKFRSSYVYIFRMDSTQARMLYQGIRTDSSFYFTNKVDSFSVDSQYRYELGWGLYYFARIEGGNVNLQTYRKEPFSSQTWGFNGRNFIVLRDLERHIINGARVTLPNGTVCPYITGMASYELPKLATPTLIKMEYGGKFDYLYVTTTNYSVPRVKNSYPNYQHTTIAPGYLVFNQPKFKYYDTVKYKAFLLNDNATAYKQKLKMYLMVDGKEKFMGIIKPRTPGAYYGEFFVADTMQVDREYTLAFKNFNGDVVKSNTFYLENYELKPNQYHWTGLKSSYLAGSRVMFTFSSLDANNLPVMDARLEVRIRILGIDRYLKDRMFVPDKWYSEYVKYEYAVDPSGYTTISFPDSLFEHFDASYEISVLAKDPDNNNVGMSAQFRFDNRDLSYEMHYEDDSFVAKSFYRTRPSSRKMTLLVYYLNRTVRKEITTPYSEPIDIYAVSYILMEHDSLILNYYAPQDYVNKVYFRGKRTGDSIYIQLENPLNLKVYYEIYKGMEKVAEGAGNSVKFEQADASAESYHVLWGHDNRGELVANFKVQSFHLYEARLNVNIRQPDKIYPGQKVDVEIQVTDQFNHGVKNVNLTAYSVNSQFGSIPAPDVPYMGLTRGAYPLQYVHPSSYLPSINQNIALKLWHLKKFNLLSNELYSLLYGKGGKRVAEMPIKRTTPELSVYVHSAHQAQNIVYIKVDGNLIYHQYQVKPYRFSFRIKPGTHTVSVRTFDRLLTYKDLRFKENNKYVLAFNLDSMKYIADTAVAIQGKLKPYETEEFFDNTVFVSLQTWSDTMLLYQKKQLKFAVPLIQGVASQSGMRIGNDNYLALGPVEEGELTLRLNRNVEHDFVSERGKAYLLFEQEVKAVPIKTDLRQYSFLTAYVGIPDIYNVNMFNELSFDPRYDTVPGPVETPVVQEPEQVTHERERPEISQKIYAPAVRNQTQNGRVILIEKSPGLFSNAWLVNHQDSSLSIINGQQRDNITFYAEGRYDLLLFTDSSYALYRNLQLQLDGSFILMVYGRDFKPLDMQEIYAYEQIVHSLTKSPFRSFTDTPVIIKPVVITRKKYKSSLAKITGRAVDGRFKTPIDFVDIYAEIDGYFKAGATTNEDGQFEINDLPPGKYMLKIRAGEYRYQVVYNLQLEKGRELVIKLNLIHREDIMLVDEYGVATVESAEAASGWDYGVKDKMVEDRMYMTNSSKSYINMASGGRGSRDVQADVFVDGVTTGNIYSWASPEMAEPAGIGYQGLDNEMLQSLDELAGVAQANRIRDYFRDYGYWVPNLLTDNEGKAYFTVTFPDNITSWKTMVPAMNDKRQSGLGMMVTRSFKPLSALMAAPAVLTEGDFIYFRGRAMNYTPQPQNVTTSFVIDGATTSFRDMQVEHYNADSFGLQVRNDKDSIRVSYMLDMKSGYRDGEERAIPVRLNAIIISKGEQLLFRTDTTINYTVPADVRSARIFVYNDEIEKLLKEIEELKQYSYGCVEQTTSKLRALLAEKSICLALGRPFTGDKMVKKMINRLDHLRNHEGTWGWWGEGMEDDRLTAYVMKTLNQARLAGYSNNLYVKAANRLEKALPGMRQESRLYALNMLLDMDRDVDYDTFIKHADLAGMDVNQSLLYTRLLQKRGMHYSIMEVTKYLKYGDQGGIYFGENTWHYYNDEATTTMLAYDILSGNDSGKEYLPYIREYMYSSGYPRHTFAMAEMISASVKDLDKKKASQSIVGEMTVNGTVLKASDYPYRKNLGPGETVSISHKGQTGFASIVTSKLESHPKPDSTYFTIRTRFDHMSGQGSLKLGAPVQMTVTVRVFKSADQVMLEIPVPAGFTYFSKPPASGYEVNREYYYDKTAIFCNHLGIGTYTFTVTLVPKFSGVFNVPPAKVELMYYPEVHNNENSMVIRVD